MANNIDINKIPDIAARLGTGFVPEGVLWEALNSDRSIDDIIMGYEYEFEESGADIPSWLDDWDMSDSTKVREAIDVITGVQEEDVYGVGGPTNEDVAQLVDIHPEIMEIADLVEQGIIDMGGDTDDFDIFMEEVDSAMDAIDDEKVDSIIALMDASSENENPDAVLANIGRLLLSAEEEIASDLDPDPDPDPDIDLVPDPDDEVDYGGYDNTTAYGAMVRFAIDYKGMSLEDAEQWAEGRTPPNIGGASMTGELPTPEEAQAWMSYPGDEIESGFDVNLPIGGAPGEPGVPGPTESTYSRQPGDQLSWFTGESFYHDEMLNALEVWEDYFSGLPVEYAKKDYGPGDPPSLAEFSVGKFKTDFAKLDDKEKQAGHIFTWLYKNAQGEDGRETFPSIGLTGKDFASIISVGFAGSGISGASLSTNKDLFYAKDLFTQDKDGGWAFPQLDVIRTHTSLSPSAEGQEYYEDLLDAGRGYRDIFNRAFEKKHPGLTGDWFSSQKSGLFQDAMIDRYFSRWDEDADIYTGFDAEGISRQKRPFAVDDEWLQSWLEDPYAHQTALFSNVAVLAQYLDKNDWGAFQGEDYSRLLGTTEAEGDEGQKFPTVTTADIDAVDNKIAAKLGLDLQKSKDDRRLFAQYKAFNPLLYSPKSAEYNSAVQAIKQAAVSALTPVGAPPAARAAMTKQISRDYDVFTSSKQGGPLNFLNHVLSGGRIVSTKSKFSDPATMDFTNPTLRLPGTGGAGTAGNFESMFEF